MNLHCLGSGGYFPNDRRHTSCFYLDGWDLVLDAGTGMFRLGGFELPPRIDILLSHTHLDHVFGLTTSLLLPFRHPGIELHLWATAAGIETLRQHLLHKSLFPVDIPLVYHEIVPRQTFTRHPRTISTFPQDHPGSSLAFRIHDDDHSIVYATDTTGDISDEFARWADRPHMLIHECYFPSASAELAQQTGHTHTERLIEVIDAVGPRQVLVTHVNPLSVLDDPVDVDHIARQTGVPVTLACDNTQIEIS